MNKKTLNVGLIGKTNAGKSTLINALVGEKISIENKKINTTLIAIEGIKNIDNTQITFYDSPGLIFSKQANILKKKIKTNIWEIINKVDLILFIIDIRNFKHDLIIHDINKISESEKPIVVIFNKIDLVKKDKILPYIEHLNKTNLVKELFIISAKYLKGIDKLMSYLGIKIKIKQMEIFK